MKIKKGSASIKQKLIFLFMILLLIVCIILFSSFFLRFGKVYRQQADSHMADVTSMSAENVLNMAEQIEQLSVSVLLDHTVQDNLRIINEKNESYHSGNGMRSISVYETAISRQVRRAVFNINGIVSLHIYPKEGEEILVGTINSENVEDFMKKEDIYAKNGASLWSVNGKEHYVCLGRAILDTEDMQLLGYMIIVCQNEYFGSQMSTASDDYSGKIYLVDSNNCVMASSENSMPGKQFPYKLAQLSDGSVPIIRDPVSEERSYYYTKTIEENQWTMITTVSTRQFWNSVWASFFQMIFLFCTVLAVSFFLIRGAIKRLLAPVGRLLESMSEFGLGRLDSRVEVQTRDEIGQIGETYNQMADNIQNLMEQVYELELANKEAEISFLKMQINPHFLYNSLDTISWLGYTAGNEKISEISVALARMLRMSINRADMITVAEEIETVHNYLFIQECRFGDKIKVWWHVDEDISRYYMPGFLLQPLVENSIVHGLEQRIEKGCLDITILRREEKLYFSVSDDGQGIEKEKLEFLKKQCNEEEGASAGKGIGLKNVYRRLLLLYGEASEFQINSEPGKGTRVSFYIPVTVEI